MSDGNVAMPVSIATPNTSDTISTNVIAMPFTQVDTILPNTFKTARGLISSEIIKKYIKQSQCDKLELIVPNSDEVHGINLWQYANRLYEISQKYKNDDIETKDTIQTIDSYIEKIIKTLQQFQTKYENVFQSDKLDNMDISITQNLFSNSKKQMQELLKNISRAKEDSIMLANNEANKTLSILVGANIYFSHSSIVLYFANRYLSGGVLLWIIRICFGISPQGAALFLIYIALSSIYKFITQDNTLKIKIYEFYCVLNAILRQIHYHDGTINALVNLNQNISGNVIIFDERALKYLTSPISSAISSLIDSSAFDEAMLYNIIKRQADNSVDINISSLLEQNNLMPKSSQENKERLFAFSIFPNILAKSKFGDNDIINTSAFHHLKNITTQFSNFLFIQSPNFTSTLALDMMLQSLKVSNQSNNPINNKSILIVANPLEVISPYYKVYEYIKSQCNSSMQDNVLFLNAINHIEKKALFDKFNTTISNSYSLLETSYNNEYYIKEIIHLDKPIRLIKC